MRKRWIAAPVVIAAPLVLAVCVNASFTTSRTLELSGATEVTSRFAVPANVTVSSVMPTWATVRFVLPSADSAAASEEVVVYSLVNGNATVASSATAAGSPVTVTGLRPSTTYYATVSVNAAQGHAASAWTAAAEFTTAAATGSAAATPAAPADPGNPASAAAPADSPAAATSPPPTGPASTSWPPFSAFPGSWPTSDPSFPAPGLTSGSTAAGSTAAGSAAAVPYAAALSSYNVLAQSYSATDIINDGWAQDANNTAEGAVTCPVANTSYSSALNAVVMTTQGTPVTSGATADCAHIRSQFTVPTSGDVVEAEIWLPSLDSATTVNGATDPAGTLLDWASMWTDGAGSTNGTENWPADTEVDAVETQYGANYASIHYGSAAAGGGSTGTWTTEPQGWEAAGAIYATANSAANVQPGWNVVDIEFTPGDANIYINGALFVTVPGSVLTHDPAYLDFGISGPNGAQANSPSWPAGPATEDVAYVKVFS
jgi:Fibronectin type III domain